MPPYVSMEGFQMDRGAMTDPTWASPRANGSRSKMLNGENSPVLLHKVERARREGFQFDGRVDPANQTHMPRLHGPDRRNGLTSVLDFTSHTSIEKEYDQYDSSPRSQSSTVNNSPPTTPDAGDLDSRSTDEDNDGYDTYESYGDSGGDDGEEMLAESNNHHAAGGFHSDEPDNVQGTPQEGLPITNPSTPQSWHAYAAQTSMEYYATDPGKPVGINRRSAPSTSSTRAGPAKAGSYRASPIRGRGRGAPRGRNARPFPETLKNKSFSMPPPVGPRNYAPSLRARGRGGRGDFRGDFRGQPTHYRSRDTNLPTFHHPWKNWEWLCITVTEIPAGVNLSMLYACFRGVGNIESIELFENPGIREGRGRIKFSPVPEKDFWTKSRYVFEFESGEQFELKVALDTNKIPITKKSPVRPNVFYPESIAAAAESLDFGVLLNPDSMMIMRSVRRNVKFKVNIMRRELVLSFDFLRQERDKHGKLVDCLRYYRIAIPFSQLSKILMLSSESEKVSFVIPLDAPPCLYRQLLDATQTIDKGGRYWNAVESWWRQVGVIKTVQHDEDKKPFGLRNASHHVNIGRWMTYQIVFDKTKIKQSDFDKLCDALRDHNVKIVEAPNFLPLRAPESQPTVWDLLSDSLSRKNGRHQDLKALAGGSLDLSFGIRYMLEVCISNGILSEYKMSVSFLKQLQSLGERPAITLLEHISINKLAFHDPLDIFQITHNRPLNEARIPSYCCYMRTATITPTTVYYNLPTVDTSNRVIRQFRKYKDHFLRVRFADEKYRGRLNSMRGDSMNAVFTRIKRVMTNGIVVGGRKFEFLAFGNSQFRENGAYFFAPTEDINCDVIREWMGDFDDIRVVAKHAARLGQCFSTTRALSNEKFLVDEIDDVERNGFNFSDGVGLISESIAEDAMKELKIRTPDQLPPSVYQFRLGGCKGIFTVSPDLAPDALHIRYSQYKFPAIHQGLEIIRWSNYAMASLNRQLITVLSALGVKDEVFLRKMSTMLDHLDKAMVNEQEAQKYLLKIVDPNQTTVAIAQMVASGFLRSQEPFVVALLELWRAWTIKYLKEKAKIVIEDGAFLFGTMDETGILRGHYNDAPIPPESATFEERAAALPEVFVQVAKPTDEGVPGPYEAIQGVCILARNPSLHPGDIRVVRAVDVRELRHLRDVIVFPQTGDRDIPSMCSGGDLDGDDYIISWDPDLFPKEWNLEPMNYTAPPPKELDRPVEINDITSFFVTYMKNDTLPTIAHAHLVWSDYSENGVKDEKCKELAELHSAAVDYNKTGQPAKMDRKLAPRKWPHFMEKKGKPKEAIYTSNKILGQLFDLVERADFKPKFDAPFDQRILRSKTTVSDAVIEMVSAIKEDYDSAMRRIMAQHEVKTEFEVFSTFVLSHAGAIKDYKFHEQFGTISEGIRDQFRTIISEKAGGVDYDHMAPWAVAAYRVTDDQLQKALAECKDTRIEGGIIVPARSMTPDEIPLISFPWIMMDILCAIAKNYDADLAKEKKGKGVEVRPAPERIPSLIDLPLSPTRNFSAKLSAGRSFNRESQDHDVITGEGEVHHQGSQLRLFGDSKNPSKAIGPALASAHRVKDSNASSRAGKRPAVGPPETSILDDDFVFAFGSGSMNISDEEVVDDQSKIQQPKLLQSSLMKEWNQPSDSAGPKSSGKQDQGSTSSQTTSKSGSGVSLNSDTADFVPKPDSSSATITLIELSEEVSTSQAPTRKSASGPTKPASKDPFANLNPFAGLNKSSPKRKTTSTKTSASGLVHADAPPTHANPVVLRDSIPDTSFGDKQPASLVNNEDMQEDDTSHDDFGDFDDLVELAAVAGKEHKQSGMQLLHKMNNI